MAKVAEYSEPPFVDTWTVALPVEPVDGDLQFNVVADVKTPTTTSSALVSSSVNLHSAACPSAYPEPETTMSVPPTVLPKDGAMDET